MPRICGFYPEKTNYSINRPEIVRVISPENRVELAEKIAPCRTPVMAIRIHPSTKRFFALNQLRQQPDYQHFAQISYLQASVRSIVL